MFSLRKNDRNVFAPETRHHIPERPQPKLHQDVTKATQLPLELARFQLFGRAVQKSASKVEEDRRWDRIHEARVEGKVETRKNHAAASSCESLPEYHEKDSDDSE